ncbi:MAG: helix-hairpin-helix domain-containing protein [Cytophagia bacterium]|nr:MAG: helix-hairpin-helix domain-containing protein [Runella sp.]TAG18408.1 MAG: helix-hairpin-helix domain-containing protein [Cytophagales bacterium]TAG37926.1 MAG: helix-hairpin-helix domain-containing protein [Cytophagia bacterium]TAG53818.1 MAG: helix-hairpin-helix domain-containing protein [Runella slithyformis]TAG79236.1 MAG: helix-hairpin-helix domain-containing protein [Cytophagales bacterium]
MKWPTALFGIVFTAFFAQAQEYPRREIDLNGFVQKLLPIQTENLNYNDLYESLLLLYTTPLDLNTCTRDELSATYLLTERQLNAFFKHRDELGKLLSIYELQAIPEFDLPTIYQMLPFVRAVPENRALWTGLNNPSDHYFIFRTEQIAEQKRGFTDKAPVSSDKQVQRFVGSPVQWYARYRYSRSRDFSVGFTLEKDEGEAFSWNPSRRQYGPDYASFHAQIQNRGRLKNLIIGDYQLQVGQGLVYSAGFILGKGMETVYTVRRPTSGARPYTSVVEAGFFRGITATYALTKRLEITALYARNHRDGSVADPNAESADDVVSSILSSGLHRIPNELEKRANLREQNVGAHLLYRAGRGQFGATLLHTTFGKNIQRRDALYNQYEFAGTKNLLLGLHGSYLWRNVNFFGEAARSQSGGIGAVAGALASLTKRWDAALLLRHYDRDFHSIYANAFGENTRNNNESGLYAGAKYLVYKKLTVGAYVDLYRFEWYKYLVDKQPTNGFDFLWQANYTVNKRLSFYAIYREEHKEKNVPSRLSKKKYVSETTRRNLILDAEYRLPRVWSFRTRAQGGTFGYADFANSKGWLVFQDFNADWGKIALSGRIAIYNTDDYDTRQYAVERDVLYAMSLPAYFERGFRNYLILTYSPTHRTNFWLRVARTDMPDRDKLSSYVDEIAASHRTEFKLQMRYRF